MAAFSEELLKEYPKLLVYKTWRKDVFWRVRVVLRKDTEGIPRKFVDIRKYIVDEKRSILTGDGVYFTLENLDKVIDMLISARKEFFNESGKGTRV